MILSHVALTKIKCIPIVIHEAMFPARPTLQLVIKAWWKVARQKAGKHRQVLPVFFFVNEHNNTNKNPQAKKQRFLKLSQKFPKEKEKLVEGKDADDILRKVLCKCGNTEPITSLTKIEHYQLSTDSELILVCPVLKETFVTKFKKAGTALS